MFQITQEEIGEIIDITEEMCNLEGWTEEALPLAQKRMAIIEKARSRPAPSPDCTWKLDDEYGMYETGCGNAFECIEGDIEENNFKFCPYCGGRIKEIVEGAP